MKFTIEEIATPSNFLSLLRLVLAIPLWYLFDYLGDPAMRIVIFLVCLFAAATDTLDGYLARKYNQVTEFGKIIDPLADKVAVGVVIIKLFIMGEIPLYYFLMILIRDVLIFIGGIFVSNRLGRVLPSNVLGKITVTIIGILILMIVLGIGQDSFIFRSVYGLSLILIVVSFIAYVIRAFEFLRKNKYESV